MTELATKPDTLADQVPKPGPRQRNVVLHIAARLAFLAVLTVVAYWDTFQAVRVELSAHTLLAYLPAAAILCIIAAIGVALRDEDEPPIHDRDTDFIVGGMVLVLAISMQGLLNRRYLPAYLVTHIDLLAMVLFLFAGCVLLFGLRPALRYRWVWFLCLSLFPLPYRMLILSFGNSRLAAGAAMLLLGVAATAVSVGSSRRRALVGATMAALVGIPVLLIIAWFAPDARVGVYQWYPAIGCAAVTCTYMHFERRRGTGSLRPIPGRKFRPPITARAQRASIVLAIAAGVLHYIGAPAVYVDRGTTIPGLNTRPPLTVPAGWHQVDATGMLPSTVNGWDSLRMRQVLQQDVGSYRFDSQSRPRRIVVDTIETSLPLSLDIYLPELRYTAVGIRESARVPVSLPHEVTGSLQTLVDDENLLTYNRLTWRWNDGYRTQQVTLFSVDNHEYNAPFPEFRRHRDTWKVLGSMVTMLLRGNAVTQDVNPEFKDRDLLIESASALIDTQVANRGDQRG